MLDDGIYLASIRTMYRVMTLADQVRERRAQAAHPPRVRPELVADGPDQVWTWDITKLKGPWRGTYFDLYVMLDIFSRKAICCEAHYGESGALAKPSCSTRSQRTAAPDRATSTPITAPR